ncbi:hypothetical protein tinsulaeT_09120 [Thalassotalea insulae]|uniref:O-antigen ligase-like membrane protein n=1 Tax=Thalassotalea insulae TaxID=2056778 RepID=A0ABQ6GQ78_9GAMM|nr:hypothetical protein [Thalassotalea insulae]GLX77572.1 hypothetical protein tinsulaeT_09120 [Thalassotalea insulae]
MIIRKENLFNITSIFLIFIASMVTALPGGVTKFTLLSLTLLNISYIKISKTKVISILALISFLLIRILFTGVAHFEQSMIVLCILFIWFLSLPINASYFNSIIKPAIFLLFLLGFIASIFTAFFGIGNFASSMLPKGLPYVFAFKGTTSTPQTYGTIGILSYLCITLFSTNSNTKKLKQRFTLVLANFALNRVTLIETILLICRKHMILFFMMLIVVGIVASLFSDNVLFTISTLQSRIDLTRGIWEQYLNSQSSNILFGNFKQPDVFYSTSYMDINYIENGYMFLLYYFGILGTACYLAFFTLFLIVLPIAKKIQVNKAIFYVAIIYFLFVPLLTHEFLSISYYLMLYLVLYVYKSQYQDQINP